MFKPVLQEVLFAPDCVLLQVEVLPFEEELPPVQGTLFWVFAFRPVLQLFPFLRLQPLLQLLCPQKYKLKSNQIQFIIRILPENDLLYSMLLSCAWFLNYSVIFFPLLPFFFFVRFSNFFAFSFAPACHSEFFKIVPLFPGFLQKLFYVTEGFLLSFFCQHF